MEDKGEKKMKKIIIPNELVSVIAEEEIIKNHISKANREIKNKRLLNW